MLLGKARFVSLLLFFVGLTACSVGLYEEKGNKPTEGFLAKKEYNVSYDMMWKTIRNVLDKERIPIATTDKNEGRITTDYVKGEQSMKLGILGPTGHTLRHKYSIGLDKSTSGISVNIIAMVEVQETGHGGGWRPLGDQKIENELENWLYEKIEKAL